MYLYKSIIRHLEAREAEAQLMIYLEKICLQPKVTYSLTPLMKEDGEKTSIPLISNE